MNRIDGDGGLGDGLKDSAVRAFVDAAARDNAESIGDAAMMLGLVGGCWLK